jgi:alpha-L-arabinofuranosidase
LEVRKPKFVRSGGGSVIALLISAAVTIGACEVRGNPDSEHRDRLSAEADKCPTEADPSMKIARPPTTEVGGAMSKIVINASRVVRPISPLLYGVNHRYTYSGFNMWDSDKRRVYPEFLSRFRYAGFSAIRYPGGRTANNYHWRRAIGPVAERGKHVDSAFGRSSIHSQLLTNEYGPDEFGQTLEQTEAQGSIVANFATADARETANWVEYMNTPVGENPHGGTAWAKERAQNGHPKPYDIEYWEIGNELAGAKTFWLGGDTTESELSEKYAFGGSTRFHKRAVVRREDFSSSASISTGESRQVVFIPFPPAVPRTETVFVDDQPWRRVQDLRAEGEERVYEFESSRGRIVFGDGTHGAIPPKGSRITVTHISGPHDGFVDYYREMKEVDPSIRVGSALNSPAFINLMNSTHPYDFLVAHSYSFFRENPETMKQVHDLMMYLPEVQASKVTSTMRSIAQATGATGARQVDVVISEYAMATGGNIGLGSTETPSTYPMSLDGALYLATLLTEWIKLGVPLAEKHSLIDIEPDDPPPGYSKPKSAFQALIGPYPCYFVTPSAHVFRMFTRMMGDQLVDTTVLDNPSRRIFNNQELESLVATASRDEPDNLYLIVINRDLHSHIAARIRTDNFDETGSAQIWTLTGPEFTSFNDETHPNRVTIAESTSRRVVTSGLYGFPPHSITAIRLRQ